MGKKFRVAVGALSAALVVVAGLLVAIPTVGAEQPTLTSVKVDAAPALDGSVEDLWAKAGSVTVDVTGGANLPNGFTQVTLKSVYTGDSVYFLAQWADATESNQRSPWQKQGDGSWKKLSTSTESDENTYYEDKFAMIWNINDSIAGFNSSGCYVTCHLGEPGKAFGNKYTENAGEIGDIWHWKGVRTNPVGQIDDQYVDSTRYDAATSPEAGRKSDKKTGGGYADNKTADGKMPAYTAANQPAPPYWILDSEKVPLPAGSYARGDEIAGIIVAPFTGDRGDISTKGIWKDGKWTLEFGRKLDTASPTDVEFTDLGKAYYFGVAVFDNAQVRHAWQSGAVKFVFGGAAAAAPAELPKTGGSLPIGALAAAGAALLLGGIALWSWRRERQAKTA